MFKSKEFRIGALVIASCFIAYYGSLYLKNNGLTQSNQLIHFKYHTSIGLSTNMPLIVNGTAIGKLESIKPIDNTYKKFVFTLSIIEGIKIPQNSTLMIEQSLLKNNQLVLVLGNAQNVLNQHDTILVANELIDSQNDFKSIMNKTGNVSDSINVLIANFNKLMDAKLRNNINQLLSNLIVITKNMDVISETFMRSQNALSQSFKNANSITNNLNNQSDNLNKVIKNLVELSSTLNTSVHATQLQHTLQNLDSTTEALKNISHKIYTKEGTLGMLINDKRLYETLETSAKNLNNLIVDIKANPSRYIHISVFNKGKKIKDSTIQ